MKPCMQMYITKKIVSIHATDDYENEERVPDPENKNWFIRRINEKQIGEKALTLTAQRVFMGKCCCEDLLLLWSSLSRGGNALL